MEFESSERIMVVDDTPANLDLLVEMLRSQGYRVQAFPRGQLAIQAALRNPPNLILLDISMPEMSGFEVCRRFKAEAKTRDIPVIFISALTETADKVEAFAVGGVDYVSKPFQFEEVQARVATHLRLRRLTAELESHKRRLEERVDEQVREIAESQQSTIRALVRLTSSRDDDTGKHIERTQAFCRALALALRQDPRHAQVIDDAFVGHVYHASALHDLGKVGIPDAVLLKRGPLTRDEFEIMKTHVAIGAKTLASVLAQYPRNSYLSIGLEICRHHHERWDGSGYPDGLVGTDIPLSARIMAVVDVYDALRTKRPYKGPAGHADAVRILLTGDDRTRPGHFDPSVLRGFESIEAEFASIYSELDASLTPPVSSEANP